MRKPTERQLIVEKLNRELPPGMAVVYVPAEDCTVDPELSIRNHLTQDTGLHIQLCFDRSYCVALMDDEGLTVYKDTRSWFEAASVCCEKAHELREEAKKKGSN